MKAVAAALVLIAGAAVVLWYGNTLNSWVLGGLIGGLAALLLSIPITLTLFSFLSRRQNERLWSERELEQEEISLAQVHEYTYPVFPERMVENVYVEEEYYPPEEEWEEEEYYPPQRVIQRSQSALPSQHLPALQRDQNPRRLSMPQRNAYEPETYRPQQTVRAKDATRHPNSRRLASPGFPGYQGGSFRSQHQSAALRTARQEAAQQYEDTEIVPTRTSKRLPLRTSQPLQEPDEYRTNLPSVRQQPRRTTQQYSQSPHHTSEMTTRARYASAEEIESTTGPLVHRKEMQTDHLDVDITTEDLRRPLVRRAPYLYEDDELRQEYAQQLDPPITRRSSRNLPRRYNVDE